MGRGRVFLWRGICGQVDAGCAFRQECSIVLKDIVSLVLGMALCWLLNIAHLGIAFLLLASGEKMLPVVYVMAGALGLVQVAYVVPLYRLLRRKGRKLTARGLVMAACATALVNLVAAYMIMGRSILHFWRR